MAFYIASCPAGWSAADGTDSTPDLRGVFIRGLNDFGSATGARADGYEDPDIRTLGSFQDDEFESHYHTTIYGLGAEGMQGVSSNNNMGQRTTSSTGGAETRPMNVALIYCMKT